MVDINISVKKAVSAEESAPKRKHVRACIVYTWDYKDSKPFWNSLRVLPIQQDEVQVFKALILIHKVLQEGHPITLKDAQKNKDFIYSLGEIFPNDGYKNYGTLIREYVGFLMRKLSFHKKYPEFNGTFEYEDYISLKTVSDPNEGYEAILDLMSLQDGIDDFQKVVFASIVGQRSSETMISALVPLVTESYGIYKFVTSMLRAMHQTTSSDEALEPLRQRYDSQHQRLFEFYADCTSLHYLTSLINIPKLTTSPPDLLIDENTGIRRPPTKASAAKSPTASPPPPPPKEIASPLINQPTGVEFWKAQQDNVEAEQERLARERNAQLLAQQEEQANQQAAFEQQQRELQQQQQMAQQQMLQQYHTQAAQGRVAELERDLLALKNQYDQDQLLLQQYDQRVKVLEQEAMNANQAATQQIALKDESLNSVQEQLNLFKSKYESIAKLYSQLRQEHLNLLQKFKKLQQKAASAQEAIDKRDRIEKDLKAKNVELADLIKERDRARLEIDKLRGSKDSLIEKLEAEVNTLKDKLDVTERNQSSNLNSIFNAHRKEMEELETKLKERESQISEMSPESNAELQETLREKDEEIEILQQTMDDALKQLAESKKESEEAIDEQIDTVLQEHITKLVAIIDSILQSGVKRIEDSLFELDSSMQGGNQNSSPSYLLTIIEKAGETSQEFATAFNNFIADGPSGNYAEIISTISEFTSCITDVELNVKGIIKFCKTENLENSLLSSARLVGETCIDFLEDLLSKNLQSLSEEQKSDKVIEGVVEIHERLEELTTLIETIASTSGGDGSSGSNNKFIAVEKQTEEELESLVDNEMNAAAEVIKQATLHLTSLLTSKNLQDLSPIDLEVNKAILAASIAITKAISMLIAAAIDTQHEIVANGKGSSTRAQFYKKNNKWTEGLISAAKAVASATNLLIQTADGNLSGKNTHEELIVASNEVASSTIQLVAAARVKATQFSKTQDNLEDASKKVSIACKSLVSQVQELINKSTQLVNDDIDFSKLSIIDNRKEEMKQQAEIIKLENALGAARKRLGDIRKYSYQDDDDDDSDNDEEY